MARIELSNIGGGGTTLSLTTTGTSGASTLAGSVLNIPVYQGQLTLTTTGTSGAATLSGDILNIPQYSGGGTPAGSAGQVQFNSTPAGSFAASSNLAWDNSNIRLNIGAPSSPTGMLNIKGAGALTTTNFELTNSGNTSIFKVLDNGTITGGSNLTYNGTDLLIGGATNGFLGIRATATASKPLLSLTQATNTSGTISYIQANLRSGGSFSLQEATSTTSNSLPSFSFTGTNEPGYGGLLNFSTNSTGDALDLGAAVGLFQASKSGNPLTAANAFMFRNFTTVLMRISASGNVSVGNMSTTAASARLHVRGANTTAAVGTLIVEDGAATPATIYRIDNDGKITYRATNTAAGTTGPQTINRPSGTVNFGIGAGSLVVTNSLCTTSSIVFATVRTNDATAYIKNVVPAAGSFTINLGANATAETSVGFFIIN